MCDRLCVENVSVHPWSLSVLTNEGIILSIVTILTLKINSKQSSVCRWQWLSVPCVHTKKKKKINTSPRGYNLWHQPALHCYLRRLYSKQETKVIIVRELHKIAKKISWVNLAHRKTEWVADKVRVRSVRKNDKQTKSVTDVENDRESCYKDISSKKLQREGEKVEK